MNIHNLHVTTLFVILTVAGPCSSCKDNTQETETVCTPNNTVLVPQDLKDRFFFKEGTYWIYKNLQTSETDSVWVRTSYNEQVSVNNADYGYIKNKCYERFGYSTLSKKFNAESRYNSLQIEIYPKEGVSIDSELFGLIEGTPLNNFSPIYRLEYTRNKYENQMGAEIVLLDSITTHDKSIYKNVLWLKYPTGLQTKDYLDDVYYVNSIGLVKFHRFTDTSNWELIRYKIVQ